MPRFPVGNLASINLAETHGWNLSAAWFAQELDTPYAGRDEIANPEGRRNVQQSLLLLAEFGLSERLALSGSLPLRHIRAEGEFEARTSGLGDAEAVLRYGALPLTLTSRFNLNLLGGLGLPTGRSEGEEFALENIQFGVGDFTGIAGFEMSWLFHSTVSTFFRSQGRFVLGANRDGYRFGDAFDNALGASIRVGAGGSRIMAQVSTLHLEQDRQDGSPVISRGGRWVYGSAGVRFQAGRRGGIIGLVQRVISVDVRGDQLVSPWNLLLGYDIRIPGHRHDGAHGHPDAGE